MLHNIDPKQITKNPFAMIGDQWMLITAGDGENCNTMTASWGGLGVLWNKPVATAYIRPQRYTKEFLDREEYFTLTFFGEEYREALTVCGRKSGRDCDKIALAGITPFADRNGVGFEEAERVIYGKKIYAGRLDPKAFISEDIEKHYNGDYHTVYICEIEKIIEKE